MKKSKISISIIILTFALSLFIGTASAAPANGGTFHESACTNTQTQFVQDDTVYTKGTGLTTNRYYRFQWFFGSTSKSNSSSQTGATNLFFSYHLPSNCEVGQWKAVLQESTANNEPWTNKGADAAFTVWYGGLRPTEDSYVDSSANERGNNYGDNKELKVKGTTGAGGGTDTKRGYLKFDLSVLPLTAVIKSATLRLFATGGTNIASVYETGDGWTEMGINWNNAPPPSALAANGVLDSGSWYRWDISSYAAASYGVGDKTLSLVVKFPDDNTNVGETKYASLQTDSFDKPYATLAISYWYPVTVTASPSAAQGGTFLVTYTKSGTTYSTVSKTTPWTENVDPGSTVTVSSPQSYVPSSAGSGGVRYSFSGYNPSSTVTMDAAKTITLNYGTQYEVAFAVSPGGAGSTTPSSATYYDSGQSGIAISATANSGYYFTGWSAPAGITVAAPSSASTTITVTGTGTVTANFAATQATTLTVRCSPETVDKAGTMQTTVSGTLTAASTGLSDKSVALSYYDGTNWIPLDTVTTATDGTYTYNWDVPSTLPDGFYFVKASFTGDGMPYLSSDVATTSAEGGGGLFVVPEYVLGSLAALAVSILSFTIYKKRSKRQ